jgi:hypothetical protein
MSEKRRFPSCNHVLLRSFFQSSKVVVVERVETVSNLRYSLFFFSFEKLSYISICSYVSS